MEVTAYWEGGYSTRVPIRDFEIQIDEPHDVGGGDTGPMPTEMLLGTIGACFAMAVYHAARKREVELPDLAVRVRGEYEGPRFKRIVMDVLSSHEDRGLLEELKDQAIGFCYVTNTILRTPELDVRVADEVPTHAPPPRPA
jgi:putative redox protein